MSDRAAPQWASCSPSMHLPCMIHCSLSGLTHPSPTGSWEALGSVKLSDERWFTVTASYCCTCSALKSCCMATFTLLCRIMWIRCMYVYKQPEHKHTLRYCIPQCTTHNLTFHFQSDKLTANHSTMFLTSPFWQFFWLCCQNLLNVTKADLQCKTYLESLHLARNKSKILYKSI